MKWSMQLLALAIPVPMGIISPLFVVGAALGRIYGEALNSAFPDAGLFG